MTQEGRKERMRVAGKCLKYIAVFGSTLLLLTGLLTAAAVIPQSAIRENVLASAEYLCEDEVFPVILEEVSGSKLDRYADSILLGIAWQYDAAHPLSSVMESAYYYTPYQNENENLLDAVADGCAANQQYLRYWHGSNVIVRPLLVLLELKEIYVLNGVLLALLTALLLLLLLRGRDYAAAVGLAAGLLMTGVWFVPLSLEYTWTFLLMLLFSIIGLRLTERGRLKDSGAFFLIAGMVTCYFDFLTTETLTLLVPLLLILRAKKRESGEKAFPGLFLKAGRAVGFWGAGYAGMWLAKWLLASVVLGENVMPYVSEHIGERLGGGIGVSLPAYLAGAAGRNISCLFPFDYGIGGWLAGFALLLFCAYVGYVYHKKQIAWDTVLLYMLPGLLPYVRYLVLHNHSYLHFFFTYRAQLATVLAVALSLGEMTERRWLPRVGGRRRRT